VFRLSSLRNEWKPDGASGFGRGDPVNIITRRRRRSCARTRRSGFAAALRDARWHPRRLVEREEPLATIIAAGFPADVVTRIDRLLNMPNTSAGRPRRASRSRKRTLAATAAIPSPTVFATTASVAAPDEKLVTGWRASADAFEG